MFFRILKRDLKRKRIMMNKENFREDSLHLEIHKGAFDLSGVMEEIRNDYEDRLQLLKNSLSPFLCQ